jgi:hypothetical protein
MSNDFNLEQIEDKIAISMDYSWAGSKKYQRMR